MYRTLFIFVALSISVISYEQKSLIDSLQKVLSNSKADTNKVKTLLSLSNIYSVNGDIQNGLYYCKWGKELSDSLQWINGIGAAYSMYGIAYDVAGDWDSAILYQIKETSIRRKINNSQRLSNALKRLSISYSNKGDYFNACNYIFEATRLDENSTNIIQLGEDYSNLGALFTDLKLYKLAIPYLRKSLNISFILNDEIKEAYDFNNLAAVYTNIKKTDSALFYILKASLIFKKKNLYYEQFSCSINLASIYNQLRFFDSAINYINHCEHSPLFATNKYMQAVTYGTASEIYINKNDINKAKDYIFKAIELANETKTLQQQLISYQDLTKVYIKDNDNKNAYKSFETFLNYNDSFLNNADITTNALSAFIEDKMNTQKKNLTAQVEKSNEGKKWWTAVTICAAILLVSGILVYRKFEQNKTFLHIKNIEQKALRAQLNPHFIFNVMQSIKTEYATNAQKGEELLVSFSSLVREVLDKSFSFEGTLEEEIELITKYIHLQAQHTSSFLNFNTRISEEINASKTIFPSLALQPVIENAIKYGPADNNIVLDITKSGKFLIIKVENNLPDDLSIERSGTGLLLTGERINLFNKKYKVKGSVHFEKKEKKFITTISLVHVIIKN